MALHDPHQIPEPILVVSGLSYAIPACMAFKANMYYTTATYTFLTLTTVSFHGTRNEYWFALDCAAIVNFLVHQFYLSRRAGRYAQAVYVVSVVYSLISYFAGKQFGRFSFDPDWNTQMAYHACMHVSTAYSAYLFIRELRVNPDTRHHRALNSAPAPVTSLKDCHRFQTESRDHCAVHSHPSSEARDT